MKVFHFLFNFVLIIAILIIMTSLNLDKFVYYVTTGLLITLTIYIGHLIFNPKKVRRLEYRIR